MKQRGVIFQDVNLPIVAVLENIREHSKVYFFMSKSFESFSNLISHGEFYFQLTSTFMKVGVTCQELDI